MLEQEVKRVIAAGQTSSTTADKARESNYKLAEQVDRGDQHDGANPRNDQEVEFNGKS